MDVGAPGRLLNFLWGGVKPPVGDVLPEGTGEEEDILLDDAHLPPQGGETHLGDVLAVHQNLALGGVIEAGDQVAEGGLSAAGGAHHRHLLPSLHRQVQVAQHRLAVLLSLPLVGEGDVLESDLPPDRGQSRGAGELPLAVAVQNLQKAGEAGHPHFVHFGKVHQALGGVHKEGDVQDVLHQHTGGDGAIEGEDSSPRQGGPVEQVGKEVEEGVVLPHGPVAVLPALAIGLVGVLEPAGFVLLPGKGPADPDAGDAALQVGVHLPHSAAHQGEGPVHLPFLPSRRRHNGGDEGKDDEGEGKAGPGEDEKGAGEGDGGDEQLLRAVVGQLADVLEVPHNAGHNDPRLVFIEVGKGQLLELLEHLAAHIRLDAHPHGVAVEGDNVFAHRLEEVQSQQGTEPEDQLPEHLPGDVNINDLSGDGGVEQVKPRQQEGADKVQGQQPLVGLKVG